MSFGLPKEFGYVILTGTASGNCQKIKFHHLQSVRQYEAGIILHFFGLFVIVIKFLSVVIKFKTYI